MFNICVSAQTLTEKTHATHQFATQTDSQNALSTIVPSPHKMASKGEAGERYIDPGAVAAVRFIPRFVQLYP